MTALRRPAGGPSWRRRSTNRTAPRGQYQPSRAATMQCRLMARSGSFRPNCHWRDRQGATCPVGRLLGGELNAVESLWLSRAQNRPPMKPFITTQILWTFVPQTGTPAECAPCCMGSIVLWPFRSSTKWSLSWILSATQIHQPAFAVSARHRQCMRVPQVS